MPKFRVCVSQLEQLPPMQSRRANDKENEKAGAEVIGEGLFCDAGPPFWHTRWTQISFINSNMPS